MKYVEEYLKDVIKVKPLGELTTKEDELNGMSGEMVYIDGKCSDIFISHADYANWVESKYEQKSTDTNFSDLTTWKYIVDAVLTKEHGVGNYLDDPNTEKFAKELQERFGSVEQKPTECIKFSNEFENQVSNLIASVLNGEHEYNESFVKYVAQSLLGYAKNELKPTGWSEEDEEIIKIVISICEHVVDTYSLSEDTSPKMATIIPWLKSIKERVQLKQRWNEKDEQIVHNIRRFIEKYAISQSAVDVNGDLCEKIYIDADNWLKNIKQRIGG